MDSGILTDILGALVNGSAQGFGYVRSNAEQLFYKLVVLELVFFGIGVALNKIDVQREIVAKIIAIGFIQYILFRYVWLVDVLRNGFVQTGLYAGGTGLSIPEFLDPSAFIALGFERVYDIIESRFSHDTWTFLTSPGLVWVLYSVAILLMFFAFSAVGLQIFLAIIEFYLVSTLAIIMIPFLVLQRTSFLGLRAINGLISICIKLMVIAFVASLSVPVFELLNFTNSEPTIKEAMNVALGALAIALLMWRAPGIAQSLISGASGLDVGSTILAPVFRGVNMTSGAGGMAARAIGWGGKTLSSVAKATSLGARNAGS